MSGRYQKREFLQPHIYAFRLGYEAIPLWATRDDDFHIRRDDDGAIESIFTTGWGPIDAYPGDWVVREDGHWARYDDSEFQRYFEPANPMHSR